MPWCPECKIEYREGFTECSDCKCELVDKLEEKDTNEGRPNSDIAHDTNRLDYVYEDTEIAYLTTVSSEEEAGVLESILRSNGIPVLRKYPGSGGYSKILLGNINSGIKIFVPEELLDLSKELIDSKNSIEIDFDGDSDFDLNEYYDNEDMLQDIPDEEYQPEDDDEGFLNEKKKMQQKRSVLSWLILLFLTPGLAIIVYYLVTLLFDL